MKKEAILLLVILVFVSGCDDNSTKRIVSRNQQSQSKLNVIDFVKNQSYGCIVDESQIKDSNNFVILIPQVHFNPGIDQESTLLAEQSQDEILTFIQGLKKEFDFSVFFEGGLYREPLNLYSEIPESWKNSFHVRLKQRYPSCKLFGIEGTLSLMKSELFMQLLSSRTSIDKYLYYFSEEEIVKYLAEVRSDLRSLKPAAMYSKYVVENRNKEMVENLSNERGVNVLVLGLVHFKKETAIQNYLKENNISYILLKTPVIVEQEKKYGIG